MSIVYGITFGVILINFLNKYTLYNIHAHDIGIQTCKICWEDSFNIK